MEAIRGDIRSMPLPEGFGEFDHVLWNMPFLDAGNYKQSDFHDHERGDVLDKFLARLPRLLKPDGEAILLNTEEALHRIHTRSVKTIKTGRKSTSGSDVYVIVLKLR
jgi:tRNA1(Val) A37 N6-methylase TrmN6